MKKISQKSFNSERDLFNSKDLLVEDCCFCEGESPLKESENIKVKNVTFKYKYPLWYCNNVKVENTTFEEMSRSGIWYTNNIQMTQCLINAPKEFRRGKNIKIEECNFTNAQETLWGCENVEIKKCSFNGDYLLMNSKKVYIENIVLNGNYFLDGGEEIICKNCVLNSKDAFWNTKNVNLYNCKIVGEYFGWNSENIYMENCEIESLQGFCYIKNLVMKNCSLKNTTLAFEYSTIDVELNSKVGSIKNPMGGKIVCVGYDELILDENCINKGNTRIEIKNV